MPLAGKAGKAAGYQPAKAVMRAKNGEVSSPRLDEPPCHGMHLEQMIVQALVLQLTLKPRTSHSPSAYPGKNSVTAQFAAVVVDRGAWGPARSRDGGEFAHNVPAHEAFTRCRMVRSR
jgi:hypothetical protein